MPPYLFVRDHSAPDIFFPAKQKLLSQNTKKQLHFLLKPSLPYLIASNQYDYLLFTASISYTKPHVINAKEQNNG